jgi:hypothetical protein
MELDQILITDGVLKGMIGRYLGKAYDEGKICCRVEFDYFNEVAVPEDSCMFVGLDLAKESDIVCG